VAGVFCQKCGTQNQDGAQFCSKCGTSLVPTAPSAKPAKTPSSHVVRNVVIVLVVVVVALVALFTVPISHSYSYQFASSLLSTAGATLSPPTGAHVMGTFSTASGGSVTFQITDSNSNVVYSTDSNYGSFSFTASSPPYTFAASSLLSESVHVSGSWSAPYL
jgi:hypothetical protein